MPSAPKLLSSWKICLVATPLAFQEIQVSTVVAAHWTSPEAMARCRSFCGIFLIVTSRPFFLKMPAWFASVSGANPVHPEIPMATFTSSATAGAETRRAAGGWQFPLLRPAGFRPGDTVEQPRAGRFDRKIRRGGFGNRVKID